MILVLHRRFVFPVFRCKDTTFFAILQIFKTNSSKRSYKKQADLLDGLQNVILILIRKRLLDQDFHTIMDVETLG